MKKVSLLIVCFVGLLIPFFSCDDSSNSEDPITEAIFEIDPESGKVGDEIAFINNSENASDYTWSFGDDSTSRLENPTHVFMQAGRYKVILFAGIDKNADMIVNKMDDADSTSRIVIIDHNITSIDLTVKDGTSWTPENSGLTVVQGATVKLFSDQSSFNAGTPDYSMSTGVDGKVVFYDLPAGTYYMTVTKNNLSNIADGYLITGVFQNQAELDAYAVQTGAVVGGLMYADINEDGIISTGDQISYDQLVINGTETLIRNIVIGN